MRDREAEIEGAGARLVFVGNGSPAHARRFRERHLPGCTVLTDTSLRSYQSLGMRRGVLATLGPKSLLAGLRSTSLGHRQTGVEGDPWQQGGLIVVVPGGELIFEQQNRDAGDRPQLDEALAALGEWQRRRPRGSESRPEAV